ncbi:MAG: hypothetical protein HYU99_06150 [Deltaproteobacteria bacterium]|nr:hypothetical protein [Deltaproteobacteria bacterium]
MNRESRIADRGSQMAAGWGLGAASPVAGVATPLPVVSAATFAGMATFANVAVTPTVVTGTFVPAPAMAPVLAW